MADGGDDGHSDGCTDDGDGGDDYISVFSSSTLVPARTSFKSDHCPATCCGVYLTSEHSAWHSS